MTTVLVRGRVAGITIARIILGVVFFAHGWQKLFTNGIDRVQTGFEAMGTPVPGLSAWLAAVVELVGGAALIVGLAVPLVAAAGIVDMLCAIIYGHWSVFMEAGTILAAGGPEVPLLVIAGLAAIGFAAQGPLSCDHYIWNARAEVGGDRLVRR